MSVKNRDLNDPDVSVHLRLETMKTHKSLASGNDPLGMKTKFSRVIPSFPNPKQTLLSLSFQGSTDTSP